jgi:hypothetical protein
MFDSFALPIVVLIFAGAAALVWMASIRLSDTTDVLSSRLGLGEALGGLLLLAIVTNLGLSSKLSPLATECHPPLGPDDGVCREGESTSVRAAR